jgi:hypothetical protein
MVEVNNMKIKDRKKNDRAAFFNLPEATYAAMKKPQRRTWRKPERYLTLASLLQLKST